MTAPERIAMQPCEVYGWDHPDRVKYGTEYVRADLHDATKAQLAKAVVGLRFYQDAWSYKINKRYGGLEWNPTEALLDDCGNTAKAVLAEIEKGEPK